jgi:nucleotide-binding universal stress UspA family protein
VKVLLAIDDSSASDRAIALVATLALPAGSHVQVVNVADGLLGVYAGMPGVVISADAVEVDMEVDRQERQGYLDEAAGRLVGPGRSVETKIIQGRPASSIVDAARESGADLIVLGSHGRGALASAVLGSVAAEVIEYASTPVLVVRTDRVSRLVLADDGSPSAIAARDLLGRMPGFRGLPVRIVSVSEPPPAWLGWLPPEAPTQIQALWDAFQADVRERQSAAAAAAAELTSAGLIAEDVAPIGDPAEEIVRGADEFQADLIVMGTRGQKGFERLLLGSVARKVLGRAHCSVLVIRARSD